MSIMPLATARVIKRAEALLSAYDLLLCDVWGVVHDGRKAFAGAGEALAKFRAGGGSVVLVSNAPIPCTSVESLLADKGVRRDAWDSIVTSGDLVRRYITERKLSRVHHIGTARDLPVFEALGVELVGLEAAEIVVATGLMDDIKETGETYLPLLQQAKALGRPLVCANPDLVVDVGGRLHQCAGAIAAVYERIGGDVFWAGKPHRIAYEHAVDLATGLRGSRPQSARILAIGDAVRTDLEAARAFGVNSLFIASGIHRNELMPQGYIDARRLEKLLAAPAPWPVAVMEQLAW